MSASSQDAAAFAASAFEGLEIGRLTWIGLTVATIGWSLLIGETTFADFVAAKLARPVTPTFHADLVDVARCLIESGFGLAIIGALQAGFGALNRFFEAVLMRSSRRPAPPVQQAEPVIVERDAPPRRQARPYRTLPDGSVEVDTIVGTRRFETMSEAREFI